MPLTSSDENDIIILGHADRIDNTNGIIYRYNIDENENTEIKHIFNHQNRAYMFVLYIL